MKIPRLVLAGTHSGVGKTTLATGLMAALKKRGRSVQGFKVGPDYIDPGYHAAATGRPSRNLDRWLLGERLSCLFAQNAREHWAVVEGVMGLFDGRSGTTGFGSTADVAKFLRAPVVLVVDEPAMSRSVVALVHGYHTFDPDLKLHGVILNRVKSVAQERILREALRERQMPVLGVLPQETGLQLPERHLGLAPVNENRSWETFREVLCQWIEQYVDLNLLEEIMYLAPEWDGCERQMKAQLRKNTSPPVVREPPINKFHLGLALDEAFHFYYQDALDVAEGLNFELVPFSPLHDEALPAGLDGVFIGGGFPELHLEKLSENRGFLVSLRDFAEKGNYIYAECGGYLYLGKSLSDFSGREYPLAGIIPLRGEMTKKLQGIGYRQGKFRKDTFLGPEGTTVHGHVFHYSRIIDDQTLSPDDAWFENDILPGKQGYARDNIAASHLHLHFAGHVQLLKHWYASRFGRK